MCCICVQVCVHLHHRTLLLDQSMFDCRNIGTCASGQQLSELISLSLLCTVTSPQQLTIRSKLTWAAFDWSACIYGSWHRLPSWTCEAFMKAHALCATFHSSSDICPMLPKGMGTPMRAATEGAKSIWGMLLSSMRSVWSSVSGSDEVQTSC